MIEIKITGQSMDEIRAKAFSICGVPDVVTQKVDMSVAASEKRKPGRPPKQPLPTKPEEMNGSHPSPLAAAPKVAPQPTPAPPAAKEPTLEETKFAVNRVLEAKGVKVAHECIKHFGANRITELAKDKWAALIDHCNGLLA